MNKNIIFGIFAVLLLVITACGETSLKADSIDVTQEIKELETLNPQLKEEFSLRVGQDAIVGLGKENIGLKLISLSDTSAEIELTFDGNTRILSFSEGQNTVETEGYLFNLLPGDEEHATLSVNNLEREE